MTTKTFDPTKPVQTRNGCPARVICTDRKTAKPIVALVKDSNPDFETLYAYYGGGRFNRGTDSPFDLVNIPERKSIFRLVRGGSAVLLGEYSSIEIARARAREGSGDFTGQVLEFVYEDGKLVETILHEPE